MARWEPGAHDRLRDAAYALFLEQGFAATTVPQIAARAGLTTRTFFRHFADKREVLFAGEEAFPTLVADSMAAAPATADPMAVVAFGLDRVAAVMFEDRAEFSRMRRAVIDADEGLRERELRKLAAVTEVIRQGLVDRGVDALTAQLTAEAGTAILRVGLARWQDQAPEHARGARAILAETVAAFRAAVGPGSAAAS